MSIIRIIEGEYKTEIDGSWTVYTDEFEAYAGQTSYFTAGEGTVFGEPERDKEDIPLSCQKTPPKYPKQYGDCNYYRWRFENFLDRHVTCSHLPPKYYFGPMETESNMPYVGKTVDEAKDWWSKMVNTEPLKPPYPTYEKGTPIVRESYGFKYCVIFSAYLMPKLSPEGKFWLSTAREYLQKYLDQGLTTEKYKSKYNTSFNTKAEAKTLIDVELDSDWFQEFAFATHPDAYLNAGLLNIPFKDKILITRRPDLIEWIHLGTMEQAWYVGKEQLKKWKNDAVGYGKQKYEEAKELLEQKIREVEKETDELSKKAHDYLERMRSWF